MPVCLHANCDVYAVLSSTSSSFVLLYPCPPFVLAMAPDGGTKQRLELSSRRRPRHIQARRASALAKKTKGADLTYKRKSSGMPKNDFLQDVAARSGLPVGSVRKLVEGLKATVAEQLRETGMCRLAGMCDLTVQWMPPCEARVIHVGYDGARRQLLSKGRSEWSKAVLVGVLPPMRSACA